MAREVPSLKCNVAGWEMPEGRLAEALPLGRKREGALQQSFRGQRGHMAAGEASGSAR